MTRNKANFWWGVVLIVLALQATLNKRDDLTSLWQLSRPESGMAVMTAVAMITFIAAFFYATVADVVITIPRQSRGFSIL